MAKDQTVDTPVETPATEVSAVETPVTETPVVTTPVVETPAVTAPVVEPAATPQVEGDVPTNTARRQDLVDAYYNTDGGLSVGGVAEKHNVRISDVYAALRDAAVDAEAKAELTRTTEYFVSRGE